MLASRAARIAVAISSRRIETHDGSSDVMPTRHQLYPCDDSVASNGACVHGVAGASHLRQSESASSINVVFTGIGEGPGTYETEDTLPAPGLGVRSRRLAI